MRLPIGVSPTRWPSIQTSAQGVAFRLTTPFGRSTDEAATLPGGTWTTRVDAVAERLVDELEVVASGGEHEAVGVGRAEQPSLFANLEREGRLDRQPAGHRAGRRRCRRHRHDERRRAAGLHGHGVARRRASASAARLRGRRARDRRWSRAPRRARCRRRGPWRRPDATDARAGRSRACSANSRYCETSAPAVTLSGMTRGTPRPRSSRMCGPGGTENFAGVAPCSTPSTNTCTPAGFDCTTSVPDRRRGRAPPYEACRRRRRRQPTMTSATAASAAVGEISGRPLRLDLVAGAAWPPAPARKGASPSRERRVGIEQRPFGSARLAAVASRSAAEMSSVISRAVVPGPAGAAASAHVS